MGKLNAYAGLFTLVAVGLLVYGLFFRGTSSTSSASGKGVNAGNATAGFLGGKRRK